MALFVLTASFLKAQTNNGVIEYGVVVNLELTKDKELEDLNEDILRMKTNDTLVNYKLHFNTNESCFFVEPAILNGYDSSEQFSSMILVQPKHYIHKKDSIFKFYENHKLLGQYTIAMEKEARWTITKESKMINGFLCYKAITPFYNYGGWRDEERHLDVTAWFAPQIPVPFGPNGYHGLPGLILEIHTKVNSFYTKNIKLNLEPEPKIDNLSQYKTISLGQKIKGMRMMLTKEQEEFVDKKEQEKMQKK